MRLVIHADVHDDGHDRGRRKCPAIGRTHRVAKRQRGAVDRANRDEHSPERDAHRLRQPHSRATSGPPSTPRPKCPNLESGNANQCLGPIAAGTYTTVVFHPTLTYTVPDGWSNMEDMAGNFLLLPPGADLTGVDTNGADYLGVYTSVVAPSLCTGEASTTIDHTFDALVEHTQNNPLLKVTNVHDVTIGDLSGVEMDLRMKPGPGDGCSDGVWVDIYVGERPTDLVHSALPGNNLRIALLRNGDATLAVEITDIDQGGSDIDDWKSAADAVAQTFEFASDT